MSQPTSPKIKGNDQTKQEKALGGMPPKKSAEEVMKVNEPGRRRAPDGFRPS
jgi:hypothetical protein